MSTVHPAATPEFTTQAADSSTQSEIITVAEVAAILKCRPSSVYNLTRTRGLARYKHPIPHIKLPCGLRFRKPSILAWLAAQETCGA